MPLTGGQVKELHEAIVSGFNHLDLERLLQYKLNLRLDRVTTPGSFDAVVHELIQWAERQGRTEDLIRAIGWGRPFDQGIQSVTTPLISLVGPTWRDAEQANRNRSAMIQKVRAIWITGFLRHSLFQEVRIILGLGERPDAVGRPWELRVRSSDEDERPLPPGTLIVDVFDNMAQALLILGAPGSGKTTLLLELARDLLDRATREPAHPMPVVFPLSTWAASRKPLVQWLIDELNLRYDVPRSVAQEWVTSDQVLPLLDGLDEVKSERRAECVAAINAFRQSHGFLPLVVTSRTAEYEALVQPPRLHQGFCRASLFYSRHGSP